MNITPNWPIKMLLLSTVICDSTCFTVQSNSVVNQCIALSVQTRFAIIPLILVSGRQSCPYLVFFFIITTCKEELLKFLLTCMNSTHLLLRSSIKFALVMADSISTIHAITVVWKFWTSLSKNSYQIFEILYTVVGKL